MRFVHRAVHRILRISLGVQAHPQMVQAVQRVQNIKTSYPATMMFVPILSWIVAIRFPCFLIRKKKVPVLTECLPRSVDFRGRSNVCEARRVCRNEPRPILEVKTARELLFPDSDRGTSIS